MNKSCLSILSNAKSTDIRLEPYPHIVIENALEDSVFQQLQTTLPGVEIILEGREIKDTWYDLPACKVIDHPQIPNLWKQFFEYHTSRDFYLELITLLGEKIKHLNPQIEMKLGKTLEDAVVSMRPGGRYDRLAKDADVSMECQFYANFTRQKRAVRGYHVDRPSELFAALLYFRQPEDNSVGGDLVVGKAKQGANLFPDGNSILVDKLPMEIDERKIEQVNKAAYQPNTLVLFLNSPKSIHAVSERSPTDIPRRHINFCCDLNFDLFTVKKPVKLALKDKISTAPLVWRFAKWI